MVEQQSRQFLRRLSEAPGPPGGEDAVRSIVRETLRGCGAMSHDRLGSILCELRGRSESPRVVLDSHLDEVAFMVQSIGDEGRLSFVTLGGWWSHVLLGQRIDILTESGVVPAVVGCKPPHFLSAVERKRLLGTEAMYFDVGASDRAQVEALGIRVGDAAVPASEFREFGPDGVVGGKALDNRIGVALMCEALQHASREGDHPNTLIGVGAVQEEIGCRGAGTATELSRPDIALILECTPADDLPGFTERQGVLGGGPQVRLYDPTAVSNRRLVRFVEETARSSEVPVQMAVRRSGGTDAKTIQRHGAGVPTVVIGVPARYIHSHVALMQMTDYGLALQLVLELIRRLDAERVASFTAFD